MTNSGTEAAQSVATSALASDQHDAVLNAIGSAINGAPRGRSPTQLECAAVSVRRNILWQNEAGAYDPGRSRVSCHDRNVR
jgi:hypothetical protein